jgi:hypothetical protein
LRAGLSSLDATRDKIPNFAPVAIKIALRPTALSREIDARIVELLHRGALPGLGIARRRDEKTEREYRGSGWNDGPHGVSPVNTHRRVRCVAKQWIMEQSNDLGTEDAQFAPNFRSTRCN